MSVAGLSESLKSGKAEVIPASSVSVICGMLDELMDVSAPASAVGSFSVATGAVCALISGDDSVR